MRRSATAPAQPTAPEASQFSAVDLRTLEEIRAGLRELASRESAPTPGGESLPARIDAVAAVRGLASGNPDAQAAAASFYIKHPEDFLEVAMAAAQHARKANTSEARNKRDMAEVEAEMKRRGWTD
ncbi:MAG: hypothetical protein ACLQAH_16775 [Limisphaerales bacterium]